MTIKKMIREHNRGLKLLEVLDKLSDNYWAPDFTEPECINTLRDNGFESIKMVYEDLPEDDGEKGFIIYQIDEFYVRDTCRFSSYDSYSWDDYWQLVKPVVNTVNIYERKVLI